MPDVARVRLVSRFGGDGEGVRLMSETSSVMLALRLAERASILRTEAMAVAACGRGAAGRRVSLARLSA